MQNCTMEFVPSMCIFLISTTAQLRITYNKPKWRVPLSKLKNKQKKEEVIINALFSTLNLKTMYVCVCLWLAYYNIINTIISIIQVY